MTATIPVKNWPATIETLRDCSRTGIYGPTNVVMGELRLIPSNTMRYIERREEGFIPLDAFFTCREPQMANRLWDMGVGDRHIRVWGELQRRYNDESDRSDFILPSLEGLFNLDKFVDHYGNVLGYSDTTCGYRNSWPTAKLVTSDDEEFRAILQEFEVDKTNGVV